jgi:hypothetical protein
VTRADLHRRLRDAPIPDEHGARERGWRVVRASFQAQPPPAHITRAPARIGIAIAVTALALVLVLTPAGAKVVEVVRDVVEPGQRNAQPALTSLPAPGQLLVTSAKGAWVVREDGSKRLLGAYDDGTWSPSGLFVAVTQGRELTAVEPDGTVRWSLASKRPVRDAAWSPSGIRIAYLAGDSLRVVAGDGTRDHRVVGRVSPVAPVWKPLRQPISAGEPTYEPRTNVLAYVDRHDRVTLRDVRPDRVLWRTHRYASPIRALQWSPDRRRLLVRTASSVDFLDARGRTVDELAWRTVDASMSPDHRQVALIRRTADNGSDLIVTGPDGGGAARRFLSGAGRITTPTWSPDGSRLLVAWRDANQWLFIHPARPHKVEAVAHISRQFDPGATGRPSFPQIRGWCCAP